MRVVAERRERRGNDLLRDALVADIGDVVDPEAAAPFGDIHIFAAILQAVDGAAGRLDDVEERVALVGLAGEMPAEALAAGPAEQLALVAVDVEPEIVGVGEALEVG